MCSSVDAQSRKKSATRARTQVTSSKKTWTGASSVEELSQKIKGTIWHIKPNERYGGLMFRYVFTNNGTVKKYSALAKDGAWGKCIEFTYTIKMVRGDDGENYASIKFGDDSDLDHARQEINFWNKCMSVQWFMSWGQTGVPMTYGDYQWNNGL